MKVSNVLFGLTGCLFVASSLTGCVVVEDSPRGSLTVLPTIEGSNQDCDVYGVDRIEVVVEDDAGWGPLTATGWCEDASVTVDALPGGYYTVDVAFLDAAGDVRGDILSIQDVLVVEDEGTIVELDFDAEWFD